MSTLVGKARTQSKGEICACAYLLVVFACTFVKTRGAIRLTSKQSGNDSNVATAGGLGIRISVSHSCHGDDDEPHRVLKEIEIGVGAHGPLKYNHGVGHCDDRHHEKEEKGTEKGGYGIFQIMT